MSSTLRRLSEVHEGTVSIEEELLSKSVLEEPLDGSEEEEVYDPNYVDPL